MNMNRTEIYSRAVEIACDMVLNEGRTIHLNRIAAVIGIDPAALEECIGDRNSFSAQVTVKLGAKIWAREGDIFGKVVESAQYKALNGAAQIKELLRSSFLYSFRGHPDFWRWLYRFEQFIIKEKVAPELLGEYADQLAKFYPIFYEAFEKGCGDGSVRPEIHPEDYYNAVTQSLMNICVKFSTTPIFSTDTAEAGERQINTIIDMAIHYLKR